jgi:beta-galactosidase
MKRRITGGQRFFGGVASYMTVVLGAAMGMACAESEAPSATPPAASQRQTLELATGWKFARHDIIVSAKTTDWKPVSVPHTWNAIDGANGLAADPQYPEGYYRGPGWYARNLDVPKEWKGRRVFIRFEGVSLVADVFVNDIPVGQHRGGFAAFCFEITPFLRFDGKDTLKVRADNSRAYDVAPLSGDFTVFGGIYRPVKLIATDAVCISPLDHASSGVFLTVKELKKESALVEVKALISGTPGATADGFQIEIADADGKVVGMTKTRGVMDMTNSLVETLTIPRPHLWQGRKDPYLYSATVRVIRDGKPVDEVTQPLGIRTVSLKPDRGFFLNGEPYALHGVNWHQDYPANGWATTDAERDSDFAMIKELGATTIRLAHYQQAAHVHDLCNRAGIIVWQEVPLVDAVSAAPQFLENARQQLTEMILQGWNHPSIGMWGLFNEIDASWGTVKCASTPPIIASLQKLAKELDPSRPTVAASLPQDANEKHRIPDGMAWNIYPGWYSKQPEDATGMIEKYSGQLGGRKIAISEYGAGSNPAQFHEGKLEQPNAGGPFHPQEWQNHFHERLWAQLKDNPHLWGTWIWVMFDFAVDKRNEGSQAGLNDKGLVTRDRKIKKDTFYFYKANWNPEPMVYITSRRATPRRLAATEVTAYSNCDAVELKLNGKSLGTARPDGIKVARWESVTLQPGRNTVEAVAHTNGKQITDSCEWTLEAAQ